MNTKWQWHLPSALDDLKAACLLKDQWREQGGYVDKGPFPQPKTNIAIQEKLRDSDTGEVILKVTAINGDTIYYEYGAQASTASAKLDGSEFRTTEINASFLVVDSTGVHETGESISWQNRITLKYRFFQGGENRMCELKAAPHAPIWYTTDGSDPKLSGGTYEGAFIVPRNAQVVLAYAEREKVSSDVLKVPVPAVVGGGGPQLIDPKRPAVWTRAFTFQSTKDTYECLERAKNFMLSFQVSKLP